MSDMGCEKFLWDLVGFHSFAFEYLSIVPYNSILENPSAINLQLVKYCSFSFSFIEVFIPSQPARGTFYKINKGKCRYLRVQHASILSNVRSSLLAVGIHRFSLHCINNEAEFIAQRFVSVGHPDLGDVGLTDIVSFGSIFQIVLSQEVHLILAKVITTVGGRKDD